jgi:mannose-6-phosphate isomerase-like protein (cupin superfamily)
MRSKAICFRRLAIAAFAASAYLSAADPIFLRRQVADVAPQPDDLTANAKAVQYQPLFGAGDKDAAQVRSVARYGILTVPPGSATAIVSYPAEEQIYFVMEGAGTLFYGQRKAAVKKDDFMYLPPGVAHGLASAGAPLKAVVMGYRIPAGTKFEPPAEPMLANADEVPLQVLSGHGPTTQFRLLMGLTSSNRDRLAAASVMDSLFIMDFAPGGTNIPHRHRAEEEIYLLLRGAGDMVAGLDAAGNPARHPVTEGAAFLFKPGTEVGYFSHAAEGQPHDLILAARSRMPN